MSSPISATAPAWAPWSSGSAASCSSSRDRGAGGAPAPWRVGREGRLHLGFEARGGRTVLAGRRFTLPLMALQPVDLDSTGVATLMLLNPTGGVLGGDRLLTSVRLGAGARVCLTTPSATRVHRAVGPPAEARFTATLGPGSALEYLPDHVIPSPGARLEQSTELTLDPDATAIVLDAWAAGRVARGEAWSFAALSSATVVRDAAGPLLVDRLRLDGVSPGGWPAGLGGAEGMAYVASLAAFRPSRREWAGLARDLDAALDGAGVRHGVTPLARGGLLARVLAPTAPALSWCLRRLWTVCRGDLLGLPALDLRKL